MVWFSGSANSTMPVTFGSDIPPLPWQRKFAIFSTKSNITQLVQEIRPRCLHSLGGFRDRTIQLPWQQGSSEQSLTDSIKLADPENPLVGASIWRYHMHKLSYSRFCVENRNLSEPNVTAIVELADPENHTKQPKITTLSYIQVKLWPIFW